MERMRNLEVSDVAIASVLLDSSLKLGFDTLGPHFGTVIHDAINRLGSSAMRN